MARRIVCGVRIPGKGLMHTTNMAALEERIRARRAAQEAWDAGYRGDSSQQAWDELYELALAVDLDSYRDTIQ